MSKYVNKTQETAISAQDFIKQNANPIMLDDCLVLLNVFTKITGKDAIVWGKIIGFGKYHYVQKASEGDWFICGFAPRASTIAIYINGVVENMEELSKKLGKFKMSGSCMHIKKVSDIDIEILEIIIDKGYQYMKNKYKTD